ncbi:elongator complex protein 3 [Desulfobulbus alkaliphilus]|uniref:elongator complex protein 3 n=1 Tax=Desulfobulbus alkaliphilus TaxID=869814 RepID=UPI001963D4B0|nr:radical SAM protein [Desulfobulbus alkaliphilus]MBM9536150.1 radical SAM protein [Desulfobulbus alkaliphilus]
MPLVIPVFIPHLGCPHRCLFCNQHGISAPANETMDRGGEVTGAEVAAIIATWLARSRPHTAKQVQVAFYGGSFTGLAADYQEELLGAVQPFRVRGLVGGIRLSTRPDFIDPDHLERLLRHRVTVIELGVQSCDDQVLRRSGRGHDHRATCTAVEMIRARGMRLGIQLMLGLPGDGFCSLRRTVGEVIRLRPDFVRLYPTLVLRGSGLEALYHRGGYRPLSLSRAVVLAAWVQKRFDEQGIQMVRMGLQPTLSLAEALVAGPHHPAFGELAQARLMLGRTRRALVGIRGGERVALVINDRDQSIFRGQRSANMERLRQLGLLERFNLRTDPDQPRRTVRLEPFTR